MIYSEFLVFDQVKSSGDQLYALCPLHEERTPSFTVRTSTEEWYCHGCHKGGNDVEFIRHLFDVDFDIARNAVEVYNKTGRIIFPSDSQIEKWHKELMERPSELRVLEGFGITLDTVKKYKLGFEDMRIMVPVKGRTGRVNNVRRYLPPHRRGDGTSAKCLPIKGLGSCRFFPYEAFDEDTIFIVEGEKDCLSARSQGLNAVTGTSGSSIPSNEIALFTNKTVYLMLDSDATGQRVSANYKKLLKGIAREVHTIKLPLKDFTQYWEERHDTNILEFVLPEKEESKVSISSTEIPEATETSLTQSEFTDNLNTWVKLEGMSVVGTDPKIYTIPCKLRLICKSNDCKHPCGIGGASEPPVIHVDPRQMLQFVDSNDSAQHSYARSIFGCKQIVTEPETYINAQKFMFQETASFVDGLDDSTFDPRYGLYLYSDYRLMPTLKYDFITTRVTDPRNQQNYYVVKEAKEVQSVGMSENGEESLEYFKKIAEEASSLDELIQFHYNKWRPLLGIEGRQDLFMAILLTYLSVTELRWRGGVIKGWLDTMVIGDTRTGKSQMAQRFVKSLQLGGYINGENARRTGVIGGVQRFGDSWVVTWGAIPMNDLGMLIIDEASGLSVEDFKELSSTRSSGAVTINKIVKSEARARTRLLWLSNPRSGRNLEDFYWKGYGALLEFIPVAEDQARFDLVLSAAREDVEKLDGVDEKSSCEVERYLELVRFAWTIKSEDILISKEVVEKIKACAAKLDEEFGGGPLVVGVAVHEKLLRLSSAIAILCGSIFDGKLRLESKHIDYAVDFLKSTLSKRTLGYKDYIEESKKASKKRGENTQFVRGLVAMHPALKVLLSSNVFRAGQIQEVLGIDRQESAKLLSELLQRGLLKITNSSSYAPDKFLVDIAKQMEV